ncbi:hypothetical protein [Streptomyces adelaidensis]|uniref:hypothetical protein n=1 Tax=Streptomyces adelaidensis TaxID=2796465 RepID=UPI0019085232|nr:hypothetical protein [Streptomyces adelaidensis]
MNELLPILFKRFIEGMSPHCEEHGFVIEVFDALDREGKKSFGVYAENGSRGFFLTAWDSGEVQVSSIDYDVNLFPEERYLPGMLDGELKTLFRDLVDWASAGVSDAG